MRIKTRAEKRDLFARRMAKSLFGVRDFVSNTQTTIARLEEYGYLTSTTKGVFAGSPKRKGKAWRELLTAKPKGATVSAGKIRFAEAEVYPDVFDSSESITGPERARKAPKITAKKRMRKARLKTPAQRCAKVLRKF